MSVKMKNSQVLAALSALSSLKEQKLRSRAALKIVKATREVEQAWGDVEKVRMDLIEEYAARDESGNITPGDDEGTIKLREETQAEFHASFRELLEAEVEFQTTISLAEFGEDFEIEPGLLASLGDLVTE